jgi:methylase of polypeptide subunit release factors
MAEQTVDFDGLTITYDDQVLEPRPWTAAQGRWAAKLLVDLPDGPILELCAGAGQIGLLAGRDTGRSLVQVDTDTRACELARRNAAAAGVLSDVRCGDLAEAVGEHERFPFVLADPPYVRSDRMVDLPDDPEHAIHGGDDGLELVRRCLGVASAHLVTDGLVLLQLGGPGQTEAVTEEAPSYGLEVIDAQTHGGDRSLVLLRSAST